MKQLTLRGASLYHCDERGLADHPAPFFDLLDVVEDVSVIGVHGFRWNIDCPEGNPHQKQFPAWDQWLRPGRQGLGMAWDSWPSFCEAWKRDRAHTYHRAWDVAARLAAPNLRKILRAARAKERPVNLVCHSLGARVVMQALQMWPIDLDIPVKRVLILNGAETAETATHIARLCPEVEFYSIGTKKDRILRYLGGLFTPGDFYEPPVGLAGFDEDLPNVHEWWLDSSRVQNWAEKLGYDLDGSGWFGLKGHHTSMTHAGNWPLYEAILNDDPVPEMRIK